MKYSQGIHNTKEASKAGFIDSMQINGIWIISPLNTFSRGLWKGKYSFKGSSFDFKISFDHKEERILDLRVAYYEKREEE